jgi:hypothetical protein
MLPVAIEHCLRDMPRAMMTLVHTYGLPRATYACQLVGPGTLQDSPYDHSSSQRELLSIGEHVMANFWDCGAPEPKPHYLDELGLQPIQTFWLKAGVILIATACTAFSGSPLLWEDIQADLELLKDC